MSLIDKIKQRILVDIDDPLNRDVHWYLHKLRSETPEDIPRKGAERYPGQLAIRLPGRKNPTMVGVANELHKYFFGRPRPKTPYRYYGCDNRCVNPFHLYEQNHAPESLLVPTDDADLKPLMEEIELQVGAYGLNYEQIQDKYKEFYTEQEIHSCLIALGVSPCPPGNYR